MVLESARAQQTGPQLNLCIVVQLAAPARDVEDVDCLVGLSIDHHYFDVAFGRAYRRRKIVQQTRPVLAHEIDESGFIGGLR